MRTDLHFIGVIIFFIVNGYRRYYGLVPVNQLIILLTGLLVGGLVLFAVTSRIFRDKRKAGIFTSCSLLLLLFFGSFQDLLSSTRVLSIFAHTRVLIIVCIIFLSVLFLRLKRSLGKFGKAILYINTLVFICIAMECFAFFGVKIPGSIGVVDPKLKLKYAGCVDCKFPSVYLVIMDEYLGSEGLKQHFGYGNHQFVSDLESKGFKVITNAVSNYKYTLFSMSSLLNMDYIDELKESEFSDHFTYKRILSLLKNNRVCHIFTANGYKIINHSNFEIAGAPGLYSPTDLPQRIELVTSQTMFHQVSKYLPVWLNELGVPMFRKRSQLVAAQVNEEIMSKAVQSANTKHPSPQFVYTHLMMPHVPYVYDSAGKFTSSSPGDPSSFKETEEAYLQYLVYTNGRISRFVGELQKATKNEAIILLMGDHGFRSSTDSSLHHNTFNAVFVPNGNYTGWYDGMSHVNQFRILFRSVFGASLPLLPDSIVQESTHTISK